MTFIIIEFHRKPKILKFKNMTEEEFKKKAAVIERKLKRNKIRTLSDVGPGIYDEILDEFASYWALPIMNIREYPNVIGNLARLSPDELMNLFGLDSLSYKELLEEYEDYANSMRNGRNWWSCLYKTTDPTGTPAGISVGGWMVRKS